MFFKLNITPFQLLLLYCPTTITTKFKTPKFHLIYRNPFKREPKQIKKPFVQSIHIKRDSVI